MATKDAFNRSADIARTDAAAPWREAVCRGLAIRKNEATEAEIVRMGKTLARLEAAAQQTVARHKTTGPSPANLFDATLRALSGG